jgi:choline dehydrogenase-like flavoprotein
MRPGRAASVHPVACALLLAFEQLGYPLAADLNGADREGASRPEINVVDGVRQSAADGYLQPILDRGNLTVVTGAAVRSLTLSGTRCTGVEYSLHGDLHAAEAAEVILSAGAIGSPHLLQLSGIGAIPYAWPMAGQTQTLLQSLVALGLEPTTDKNGSQAYQTVLYVGRGVPDAWITPGQAIAVSNLTNSYDESNEHRKTYGADRRDLAAR